MDDDLTIPSTGINTLAIANFGRPGQATNNIFVKLIRVSAIQEFVSIQSE